MLHLLVLALPLAIGHWPLAIGHWGGVTRPSVFVEYRNLLVEKAILTNKFRPSVV